MKKLIILTLVVALFGLTTTKAQDNNTATDQTEQRQSGTESSETHILTNQPSGGQEATAVQLSEDQEQANSLRDINRGSLVDRLANVPRNESNLRPSGKTFVTLLAARIQHFILSINCRMARRYFTTAGRCESVQSTPFHQMRFYIAPPRINAVHSVAIPDGRLKDHSSHHAVAVVDPFPRASFGHLVMIFYVDGSTKPWCRRKKGLEIGPGLCLTLARRGRCKNFYRSRLNADELAKKCEVNFLPLVYDEMDSDGERRQLLKCVPLVAGFGDCPKQLVTSSQVQENCELVENTQRCYTERHKATQRVPLCRLFATCDHAVALFGGWNNITMQSRHEENVQDFYEMLRRNGFRKNDIQIFYNGNGDVQLNEPYPHGLPASDKLSIRNHVTTLCQTDLCVDSFVIYFNGPTTADGSILLWDINGNGEAEENEVYTVAEFLDDITNCDANHLFIFADESYAGMLTSSLRQRSADASLSSERATSWNRVVLLASGGTADYSWNRDVTQHWSSLSIMHSVSWAFETLGYLHSVPTLTSRRHAEDYTVYGAPVVEGLPMYAEDEAELRSEYMGCQNLPLAQWILEFSHNFEAVNEK